MDREYKEYVLVQQARLFALAAHAAVGQKRKYTGEDYIVHPAEVAELVDGMTDKSVPEDGPRAIRKMIDRARLASSSPQVQTIKLADLCSNTKSIVDHDPKFAKVYLNEKALLLNVMRDGSPWLWNKANTILIEALKQLEVAA